MRSKILTTGLEKQGQKRWGWYKMDRQKRLESWYKNSATVHLYDYLCSVAAWEPEECQGIELKVGECLLSVSAITEATGLSKKQIAIGIAHLEGAERIQKRLGGKLGGSQGTLFYVVGFEDYKAWLDEKEKARGKARGKAEPENDQNSDLSPYFPKIDLKKESKKEIKTPLPPQGEPLVSKKQKSFLLVEQVPNPEAYPPGWLEAFQPWLTYKAQVKRKPYKTQMCIAEAFERLPTTEMVLAAVKHSCAKEYDGLYLPSGWKSSEPEPKKETWLDRAIKAALAEEQAAEAEAARLKAAGGARHVDLRVVNGKGRG